METLVTLAILSWAITITLRATKGPSPQMQLQRRVSDTLQTAAEMRLTAVTLRSPQIWDVSEIACEGNATVVVFFANGSANGPDLCMNVADKTTVLKLSRLNGRYLETK